MSRHGENFRLAPTLLFAFLLISAQLAAALHAFEHDSGTPQNNVCATCIAAGQLASACVDSPQSISLPPPLTVYAIAETVNLAVTHHCVVRQRGPPTVA